MFLPHLSNMTENHESIRPHAVAVGGIFLAVLKAVKRPLVGIALLPFAVLFPNLASNLYYLEFSKQNIVERKRLRDIFCLRNFIWIQMIYFIFLYVIYETVSIKAQKYLAVYTEKALNNKVLQIATPEQIEYARNMSFLFSMVAITLFVIVILMATYSFICSLNDRDNLYYAETLKNTVFAVLKNLHLYILIFVLFYVLAMIVENSFAHYKMIYLESVILNKEGTFNPVYVYLFIRIYILYILYYVLHMIALRSVNDTDSIKTVDM